MGGEKMGDARTQADSGYIAWTVASDPVMFCLRLDGRISRRGRRAATTAVVIGRGPDRRCMPGDSCGVLRVKGAIHNGRSQTRNEEAMRPQGFCVVRVCQCQHADCIAWKEYLPAQVGRRLIARTLAFGSANARDSTLPTLPTLYYMWPTLHQPAYCASPAVNLNPPLAHFNECSLQSGLCELDCCDEVNAALVITEYHCK
jgi:hypothetical protein